MYKSKQYNAPKPKEKKVISLFRDLFSGKFLIQKQTIKWYPYLLLLFAIAFALTMNERIIINKEKRNKNLQDKHDSIVVEFRKMNEIIFTEDETKLRKKAEESGFEAINEHDYYKIYKGK